jgi:hypothetical protein
MDVCDKTHSLHSTQKPYNPLPITPLAQEITERHAATVRYNVQQGCVIVSARPRRGYDIPAQSLLLASVPPILHFLLRFNQTL